jgi:hypothetical protein
MIDGKALRRSFERAGGACCWRIATDAKSNEIAAVPALLKMLSLKGAIVTPMR